MQLLAQNNTAIYSGRLLMKITMKFKTILLITSVLIPSITFAGGTNFSSIRSAKALSLGGLYYSGIDGVSAVYSNPANLAYLNNGSLEFSVLNRVHEYDYKSSAGKNYKSYAEDTYNISIGGVYKVNDKLTIGLGYYNVFDYDVSWPYITILKNSTNSSVQPFNVSQTFKLDAAAAAGSYSFGNFSLGISANVFFLNSVSEFYQSNPQWQNNIGLSGYQFKYNQDAVGFGLNFGLNFQMNSSTKISFLVKQGTSFSLSGDAETNMFRDLDSADVKSEVKSDFDTPWLLGAGVLYDINDNWKINCDLTYSLWGSTNKDIYYNFENDKWNNHNLEADTISGYNPFNENLDFEDTFEAALGVEYFNPSGVSLRAGYRFIATQNSSETFSYLFPNTNEHWITAGINFSYENFVVDAGIAVVIGSETEIDKGDNNYFAGAYKGRGYYPSITINYKF